MQYPENSVFQELAAKYGTDNISFHRELDKITGPLFRINWYRIILDEAHAIKNSESRSMFQFAVIKLELLIRVFFSSHHQHLKPAVHLWESTDGP